MSSFAKCLLRRNLRLEPRIVRCCFHSNPPKLLLPQFAQGRGVEYWSETTETERINDMLNYYGLQKWGFVIYRCTYSDDSAWERFMHHLNARKDAMLKDTYDDAWLAEHLDWNVQQDPSLDRASKTEVRNRFRAGVATDARAEMPTTSVEHRDRLQGLLWENPRYKYCIYVDAQSMRSVLDGPPPTRPDLRGSSYVNLIRADEAWEAWEQECSQVLIAGVGEDPQDENEPEIEGRTSRDVGWMRVSVDGLIPELYEALVNDHIWDAFYVRPNEGVLKL